MRQINLLGITTRREIITWLISKSSDCETGVGKKSSHEHVYSVLYKRNKLMRTPFN